MSGAAVAPVGAAEAGAAPARAPTTRAEAPARAESLAESFMWGLRIPNWGWDGTCESLAPWVARGVELYGWCP
ncbi:hypothetical protein GCM10010305_03490 [Streptomyces termitum]|uniref:Uncharacterized protein n=1 Tax=Streptomyces termitum TaxID=67368 RepID=A0A918SR46_9ACTN|nr:hypothetical protein GCM10010305_03490 [Streptomyces termitum]